MTRTHDELAFTPVHALAVRIGWACEQAAGWRERRPAL